MTQLATEITAVTVYPDRARVARRGKTTLEPGLHRLEVANLPVRLVPDSLRSTAHGTARARLLGVQLQRGFFVEAPAEQIRDLERQIEALQEEIHSLDSRAELLGRSQSSLHGLAGESRVYATALASGEMSVEKQLELLDNLWERFDAMNQALQDLARQKREADKKLQKLKKELEGWQGNPRREQFTAQVEVEILETGELTVELTYVVNAAGWQPLYDLRLVEQAGRQAALEVGYLAQVTQNTGEAWQDVALTLSTARPAIAGQLPELNPWYIQPRPPIIPQPRMAAMPSMMAKIADTEQPPEMPARGLLREPAAEVAMAAVDSSGPVVTYRAAGAVTIPADGAPHKTSIASYGLKPELDYVTAPKLVEAVYRRAKAVNASPYTLLPGRANLFFGEEFIGTTDLKMVAPQEEIELYLGNDDRIRVERELKRREVDKRLIGSRRRLHYGYEISLENLLPSAAKISLHDQLPVARHEDIKVRLDAVEPRPAEESELNELKWELTLQPQEKLKIRFDFSVEYPQEMDVTGLP